jgi:HlyD family type I secretion membrane fusion protein
MMTVADKIVEKVPNKPAVVRPAALGIVVILVFIGGFGTWAALAPLASAVLAAGIVTLDADTKTLQHLEGGIVTEIHVREGQRVATGDLLLVLSDIQSKAASEVLNIRYLTALAEQARLIAERDDDDAVVFPQKIMEDTPFARNLREGQVSIFQSRRLSVTSQSEILNQGVAQLNEQITGLKNVIIALERQVALSAEEIKSTSALVNKGLERRSRLLSLKQSGADIEKGIAESTANIAGIQQQIGETQLRIIDLRVRQLNEASEKLRDVDEIILDAHERLVASRDVLQRTELRAPVNGQVMELVVSTIGGVVSPSQPLLTIVPNDVPLIVEALVKTTDIDNVYPGLLAQVRLSAFSFRTTPLLPGVVVSVSADAVEDPRTGIYSYKARIKLPDDASILLGDDKTIIPGMPAEVQIQISPRSLLDYLISPILTQLEQSFRES